MWKSSLVVPITLNDYWYETISETEAKTRLSSKNINPDGRKIIEGMITKEIIHYITLNGNKFREYVDFGDGVVRLLLLLPVRKKDNNTFEVSIPIYPSSNPEREEQQRFSGIVVNEYKIVDGKLFENGKHRTAYRFSSDPKNVKLDASLLLPNNNEDERGYPAICEFVCAMIHASLDISIADELCCFYR